MSYFSEIIRKFDQLDKTKNFIRPQYVKDLFNLKQSTAHYWLEAARRHGFLDKTYLLRCPICERVLESYEYLHLVPEIFVCDATTDCDDAGPFLTKGHVEEVYKYHEQ